MEKAGEKHLEKLFTKKAVLRGLLSLKFVSPGYSGVGDRILIGRSRTWYAEIKTTGKTRSPRQKYVAREFLKYGYVIHLIDSYETLDNFFKLVDDEIRTV